MHRKFQKKRVIFRSWEACTISRPFFRSFLCKTAPRRPHLKNKSKPVRDRLAHAPLKTARRRPRFRQIYMISAVAHSLSARQTAAASRLRGARRDRGHMWAKMQFFSRAVRPPHSAAAFSAAATGWAKHCR